MAKKDDVSNKALAGLLIAAIVISLSGTMMLVDKNGITGYDTYANETASSSVNITGTVSIRLNENSLVFGNGYVTAGYNNCTIFYDGSSSNNYNEFYNGAVNDSCSTWSNSTVSGLGIEVENDGNVNVSVAVYANNNAASFIGGTSPEYKYGLSGATSINNCQSGTAPNANSLANMASMTNAQGTETELCNNLPFADGSDIIRMGIGLTIPSDAVGYKTSTITLEANQKV